jgi:DNA (cytosine-5)-methyltransferase 1
MIITHAKKPTDKKAYKYLSLFSGIEAASVAWKDFGWSCVGVSEIDPFPCEVLKNRFPNVPNLGDITKITEEQLNDLKHRHGGIDIVVGGSPCQSFSLAGKRLGLKDPRGNLMFEYCRVVRAVLPKYFIWENVIGALSSNGGKDFSSLIGEMVDIGYSLCWRVLDAQHFGVPQRRRRVFLVGSLGENNRAFDILFEQEGITRDLVSCRKARENNPHPVEGSIGNDSPQIAYNITFNDANGRRKDRPHGGCYINETNTSNAITTGGVSDTRIVESVGEYYEHHQQDSRIKGPKNIGSTVTAMYGTGGGNTPLVLESQSEMAGIAPSVNEMRGSDAVRLTAKVRRLTPLECERLQGFPDNWTEISYRGKSKEKCPMSSRYKALGNSMAVPVMRFIGLGIMGQ